MTPESAGMHSGVMRILTPITIGLIALSAVACENPPGPLPLNIGDRDDTPAPTVEVEVPACEAGTFDEAGDTPSCTVPTPPPGVAAECEAGQTDEAGATVDC